MESILCTTKIRIKINDLSLLTDYGLVAFTDHEHIFDPNFLNLKDSVHIISGVEICCRHKGQNIEILGYIFDAKNNELVELVNDIKELRITAIKKILNRNGFLLNIFLIILLE